MTRITTTRGNVPKAVPKAVSNAVLKTTLKMTPKASGNAEVRTASKSPRKSSPAPASTLTLSSKNYSSWSLRGWLMMKMSGIPFKELLIAPDDSAARAELLLLSPSVLVPRLDHEGCRVWDTLAIGEYLNEIAPKAGLLPVNIVQRAHCRSICGEMHSGFSAMRASLPMNIKTRFDKFKAWSKAQNDIGRVFEIWRECLTLYKGPYLFGKSPCMADAMFAPVVTRFITYDIKLDAPCQAYCDTIMAMPHMQEWVAAARAEPDDIEELEMEF